MAPVDTASLAEFLAKPDRLQTVRYELNVKDYTKACLAHPMNRRQLWIGWFLGAMLLLVALWDASVGYSFNALLSVIVAILIPIYIRHWIKRRMQKQMLSIQNIFSEPIEISYGTGALVYKTAVMFEYAQWLYQVVRTREYRLLGTSDQSFYVVPLRAFENPVALAEFDNITSELAQGRVVGK